MYVISGSVKENLISLVPNCSNFPCRAKKLKKSLFAIYVPQFARNQVILADSCNQFRFWIRFPLCLHSAVTIGGWSYGLHRATSFVGSVSVAEIEVRMEGQRENDRVKTPRYVVPSFDFLRL